MSNTPEDIDIRKMQKAYAYAQTIDDAELLRYMFAACFTLFVESFSEDYEDSCLKAIQTTMDKRK